MPSALVCACADRPRLPHIAETNVDAVLALVGGEPIQAVLFCNGNSNERVGEIDEASLR